MSIPKQTIPMKEVRNDRRTTITHDFIPNHKYEVIVRAIGEDGQQQAMESSARNTIVVQGKQTSPSMPSGLTATGYLNDLYLAWTNPADYDFSHVEIWMSSTNDISTATKIAETGGITYIDAVGTPSITRYYWIRAVNTSQEVSDYHPDTTAGVSGTSVQIEALWIGSINADNITSGTLTGRVVQTAASGQRIKLDVSDNTIKLLNAAGSTLVKIDDNIYSSGPGIHIEDATTGGIVFIRKNFTNASYLRHNGLFINTSYTSAALVDAICSDSSSFSIVRSVRATGKTGNLFEGICDGSKYYIDEAGNGYFAGNITVDGTVDTVDIQDHSARHENNGADEISVAGLSGLLATAQTPAAHNLGDHSVAAGNLTKYIKCNDGSLILEWITPANLRIDIGAAATSHTHDTGDITDIPAYGGAEAGKVLTVNGSGTGLIWV